MDKIQSRFSLDDALISANRDKKHDCEHMLRSNIASLLLWTRDVKGMTTGLINKFFYLSSSMKNLIFQNIFILIQVISINIDYKLNYSI